jgi:hypothetical protein
MDRHHHNTCNTAHYSALVAACAGINRQQSRVTIAMHRPRCCMSLASSHKLKCVYLPVYLRVIWPGIVSCNTRPQAAHLHLHPQALKGTVDDKHTWNASICALLQAMHRGRHKTRRTPCNALGRFDRLPNVCLETSGVSSSTSTFLPRKCSSTHQDGDKLARYCSLMHEPTMHGQSNAAARRSFVLS